MRTTRYGRTGLQVALLVGAVLLAVSATAAPQVYQLTTGVWGRGDGLDADVPFVGKALDNCDFLVQGQNNMRTKNSTAGTPKSHTGFMIVKALNFGCPSGMGAKITGTAPGAGAELTIPPNLITRPMLGYLVAVTLPFNPNLVQADTSGTWKMPNSTRGMGSDAIGAMTFNLLMNVGGTMRTPANCVEATCMNLPPFRKLLKSAWQGGPMMTFNGQSGRIGPDFTWCWGNPGCTTINDGVKPMIVRYKAGPNRFGGTMNQLVNTGIVGSLAIFLPGLKIIFNPLDAGMGAIQVEGRGYADFGTDYLVKATKAYMSYKVMSIYQMALMKSLPLITMVTRVPPSVTTAAPFNVPQINRKYGFPLTTGTVIARRVSAVGNPVETVTAMGGDVVTAMGARNISLVTGSLSSLSILNTNTAGMSQLFLPEPSRTGQLLAGVLALLGVAAWRSPQTRAGRSVQMRRGSRP